MTSDPEPESRAVLRLMRLLRSGPASLSRAARQGKLLLTCGERGTLAVDVHAFERAVKAGYLQAMADGTVALSQRGRTWAKESADALSIPQREGVTTTVAGPWGSDRVTINQAESPLTQIAARKDRHGRRFLRQAEVDAGERLRRDYEHACLVPRLGINWEQPISKGKANAARPQGLEMSEAVLAARQRVERAIAAVGPELAGILVDVCCFLKGLERVEAERGWPARSAKIVLKTALSALDRNYRPARTSRAKLLHWGSHDYRPKLARAEQ